MSAFACLAWRHPKPIGAAGRCIGGGTDLAIDRRKAKRLAHRIRKRARREGYPHVIHTSPLKRCALVGRILRAWGWRHHVHAALREMDFGQWDGRAWSEVTQAEVDAWCADFLQHRPGGGEALNDVFERVLAWWHVLSPELARKHHGQKDGVMPVLVVAHGGWMLTARWLATHAHRPSRAEQWPSPPAYGQCWELLLAGVPDIEAQ